MLDIQKSMLYFLRFPMFVDMVFYLKVELHAFPSEMKIEHTVNMKTGNIKIRWLECQFYVKKLSSLTFSFCSTAKANANANASGARKFSLPREVGRG